MHKQNNMLSAHCQQDYEELGDRPCRADYHFCGDHNRLVRQKMSEKKQTPQERWQAQNMVKFTLKVAKKTEADILAQLEKQENKSGYIKTLIRKDIEKQKQQG